MKDIALCPHCRTVQPTAHGVIQNHQTIGESTVVFCPGSGVMPR